MAQPYPPDQIIVNNTQATLAQIQALPGRLSKFVALTDTVSIATFTLYYQNSGAGGGAVVASSGLAGSVTSWPTGFTPCWVVRNFTQGIDWFYTAGESKTPISISGATWVVQLDGYDPNSKVTFTLPWIL